jgi:hypothetical protein
MYRFKLYHVDLGHRLNYVNSLSPFSLLLLLLFYFRFIHKSQQDRCFSYLKGIVETFQIIHFLHEIVLFHCKNYLRNIPLLILTLAPYKYNGILCDSTRKSQNSKKKKIKKIIWWLGIKRYIFMHTNIRVTCITFLSSSSSYSILVLICRIIILKLTLSHYLTLAHSHI